MFLRKALCTSLYALILACPTAFISADETECQNWVARLETREGLVEVKLAGADTWQSIDVGTCVAENSQLRVSGGRAVLRLPNESYLRASSDTLIEFSTPAERSWITLLKGWLHFLTRTPTEFDVETPYVNAGVKGTEFTISVDESAQSSEIAVLEGSILANDGINEVALGGGNRALFQAAQTPSVFRIDSARDSVQWTLYYSPLLVPDDPLFADTRSHLSNNNYLLALNELDNIDASQQDSDYYSLRSSIYLYTGNVALAEQQIAAALARDSDHPLALALQGIVEVTQHRLDAAQQSIDRALARSNSDRERANALLARSYLQQSRYQLADSLSSLEDAVRLEPDNALLLSRHAELALMLDDYALAERASLKATQLQPRLGHAHSTRGFVLLQNLKFDAARAAFSEAVRLDSSDPLPHLGLGLIAIRKNDVDYGRRKLELAAVLDPGHSLIRSYLGKAYFTERRGRLASTQYDLATQMDPNDPTPWLYRAILQQSDHELYQALQSLDQSLALNDNRIVYRSRLNLDGDEAARMASQAGIYKDLGLADKARNSAAMSVQVNPGDASGHLMLAQSYADSSKYDKARADETLQAQIFQPLTATPINPILGVQDLGVIQGTEPGELSFNEYGGLFNRERNHLQLSNTRGSNNTRVDAWYFSGLEQNVGYSLGQYLYDTDGYRENSELNTEISSAYLQWQQSKRFSLHVQGLFRKEQRGDLSQHLLDTGMDTDLHFDVDESLGRLGIRYSPTDRIEALAVLSYREREEAQDKLTTLTQILMAPLPMTLAIQEILLEGYGKSRAKTGELRFDYKGSTFYSVFGIRQRVNDDHSSLDASGTTTLILPPPFPPLSSPLDLSSQEFDRQGSPSRRSVYNYWYWSPRDDVHLDLGVSYRKNNVTNSGRSASQFNPKFGISWQPNDALGVRFAAFRNLHQGGLLEQTLEPAHIAGFAQAFDALDGTDSKVGGLEIDYKIGSKIVTGLQLQQRELELPLAGKPVVYAADESFAELRVGFITDFFSTTVKYKYDRYRRDQITGSILPELPLELDTQTIPLEIRIFTRKYGSLATVVNFVDQEGGFEQLAGGSSIASVFLEAEDRFTIIDLNYELALFNNKFQFSVSVKNALDKTFAYEDINLLDSSPRSFRLAPSRTVLSTLTLFF